MPQKSKANIVALDAENQPIAGLWAANEQIKLYDQHDAYWVARIKDDDFSKEQGAILLRSYGIKQGLGAHYLQKHFEKVWGWMSQIYLPPLNRGLIDLDARWQQATTRLQNDMSVEIE